MSLYLGIDTSAYTSSVAIYNRNNGEITDLRRPLQLKPGSRGLRQSEAFFQHVNFLPGLIEDLCRKTAIYDVRAVGVSAWPRRVADSYMPVFRAGVALARVASQVQEIPLHVFSHQEGHLFSGLYEYPEILLDAPFTAIHFSGGTSEIVSVQTDPSLPVKIQIMASSSDLNVGQLIDRVGLKLGLPFPAGPALEELARHSGGDFHGDLIIPVQDGRMSFSGAESRAYQLLDEGVAPADLAYILLQAIADSLARAILWATKGIAGRKVLLAGGVMANAIIRMRLGEILADESPRLQLYFTSPRLSTDNAAGIAYLTYLVDAGMLPGGDEALKGMMPFEF